MSNHAVIFPADPLNERRVDPEFEAEWDALQFAGVQRALVAPNLESAVTNGERAFRNLPEDAHVLYRGWMLNVQEMALLSHAVHMAPFGGSALVTSPGNYIAAHHLVNWVDVFEGLTPKTAFVHPAADDAEIVAAAEKVGGSEFFVKDWVKSRKHEWETAAYAPSIKALPAIVCEFVRLQGEYLVGQVAIREYAELDEGAGEQRLWWAHGELAMVTGHPDTPRGQVELGQGFFDEVQERVRRLGSPFVTTDVAATADGRAIVIEVGDGQVSGLPVNFDPEAYAELIHRIFAS